MANITNLSIDQGTTWSYGFAVKVDGTPIDQTWTAAAQIRATVSAVAVLHAFTAAVGSDGTATLSLTPAETSAFTWQAGVYDVVVTSPAGVVVRVAQGTVTISPEVTR